VLDFPQESLADDLSIQADQELPPCGKIIALPVAGQIFADLSKRYRGMGLKRCGKMLL
jgi:hypothetical protein